MPPAARFVEEASFVWYPYPFLDVRLHGYVTVGATVLAISALLFGLAAAAPTVAASAAAWSVTRVVALGRSALIALTIAFRAAGGLVGVDCGESQDDSRRACSSS
jgi:hypothetical protein